MGNKNKIFFFDGVKVTLLGRVTSSVSNLNDKQCFLFQIIPKPSARFCPNIFYSVFKMSVPRKLLFDEWLKNNKDKSALENLILSMIGRDVDFPKLKQIIKNVCCGIQSRWIRSNRMISRFFQQYSEWISKNQDFSTCLLDVRPSSSNPNIGRPKLNFSQSSLRTRKRKAKQLIGNTDTAHLLMAAEMKLRSSGKRNSAKILQELGTASPSRGTALKNSRLSINHPKNLQPDHALALIVDTNLSTHQYNLLREHTAEVSPKMYPSYTCIKKAKVLCYPENITVTESYAEIQLQSLIDHSLRRLCVAQEEVLLSIPGIEDVNAIIKWGCDGSEQSSYKQKFSEENTSDSSMFFISIVLLQLYATLNERKVIIWNNPAPSSTRYCRPIKFLFTKETRDVILREVESIKHQILVLQPTQILTEKLKFEVKSNLVLCMIDGKVCNALSAYTSSQVCYICGASPKNMNNLEALSNRNVDTNMLEFGISPLHSWIRCFECMLHIAYRIEIKTWCVRGEENKEIVKIRKEYIQNRFRNEVGLLVDMPKQKSGSTNDGNTARRFFGDPKTTAKITGLNENLLQRFHTILSCIGCGFQINHAAFDHYTRETRELYLSEYAWYMMPVSVHKILFHGKDIIASCILPIGQLSEEAQESRNKDVRNYRELYTRKTSRIETNTDLLHRLLISSDPYICSLRKAPLTKKRALDSEVLALLSEPEAEYFDSE